MAVDVLVVRHAVLGPAHGRGLSPHGEHQVQVLATALHLLGYRVDCLLSSRKEAARQTAERLRDRIGAPELKIHEMDCLTPYGGPGHLLALLTEACAVDPCCRDRSTILLVGHEGRLSDLITEMTGRRTRPLGHAEVICVSCEQLPDLVAGRGVVRHRFPCVDHQEAELQSKVQSKMTVSTFLAGFVFTALSGLLLLRPDHWSIEHVISVVALTVALTLFVACVYIFDQLGMPSGFWTDNQRPRLWASWYRRRERRREERWEATAAAQGPDAADERLRPWLQDGPRYHLMVGTSRYLFTSAAWLSLAGFVALLKGTGDTDLFLAACAGLLISAAFALARRPDLGAD